MPHSKGPDWPEIGWPSEEHARDMLAQSGIQGRQWKLGRRERLRAWLFGSHLEEFLKPLDRPRYRETYADERAYLKACCPKLVHRPWRLLEAQSVEHDLCR